jgi:hypothetical protein
METIGSDHVYTKYSMTLLVRLLEEVEADQVYRTYSITHFVFRMLEEVEKLRLSGCANQCTQ